MALIICPDCGKEFSDRASACPNCGCPNDAYEQYKISSQVNNLLELGRIALNGDKPKEAFDYASKALEADSTSPEAWYLKMEAASQRVTLLKDIDSSDTIEAGKQYIKHYRGNPKQAEVDTYAYYLKTAVDYERYALNACQSNGSFEFGIGLTGAILAAQAVFDASKKIISDVYGPPELSAIMLINAVPDGAFYEFPVLANILWDYTMIYCQMTDAIKRNHGTFWAWASKEYKNARTELVRLYQGKAQDVFNRQQFQFANQPIYAGPPPVATSLPPVAPQPKFCPNCGQPIAPTDTFCAGCGCKLI